MKFVIVLACLLALAFANDEKAEIIKQYSEVNPDSFKYEYELTNHIKAIQDGVLKDKDNWLVKGEYEFVDPHGRHIKVHYVADEHGYHPQVEYHHK